MKRFLTKGWLVFFILLLIGGIFAIRALVTTETPAWVTGTITKGSVQEVVSVSGVLEAEGEATLSFPTTGIVREILVDEGTLVVRDQILATLEQGELLADRQDAYAALLIAQANKTELLQGPREEARNVTDSEVAIVKAELERITEEEAQKVENAYRTLLSDDLEALPINRNTESTPPTISGTYGCGTEGVYTLAVFRSGAKSGYSYRLSGLESGTYTAHAESPAPLGTCGLSIQFAPGVTYGNQTWEVYVPNTRGANYTTNFNAYALALQEEANAVSAATQALEKALREQVLENATPREEALSRADAAILQAEARLAAIDAKIQERTLRAPFEGVISDVSLTEGEVPTGNDMTLVASNVFELTVRVPEIDITKLHVDQPADIQFDARPDEIIRARVGYISEKATEIDGVAYFEATLRFDTAPDWLRSGLNADVHIIVEEKTDTLRVPRRFLLTEGTAHHLLYPSGNVTEKRVVDLLFTGNDGYAAVSGTIKEGDLIVAP